MARGLLHLGALSGDAVQDIIDTDAFQGPIAILGGAADVINPHIGGNYIVNRAGVDAMTIVAPTVLVDDGLTIAIYSDSAQAHTLTASTACFANGTALKTIGTFGAFKGAGVLLRAWNGTWQVIGSTVVVFT